jgi:hypothetical protein
LFVASAVGDVPGQPSESETGQSIPQRSIRSSGEASAMFTISSLPHIDPSLGARRSLWRKWLIEIEDVACRRGHKRASIACSCAIVKSLRQAGRQPTLFFFLFSIWLSG